MNDELQCELENDDDCWVRAYTGPMATEFDYEALKNYRSPQRPWSTGARRINQ